MHYMQYILYITHISLPKGSVVSQGVVLSVTIFLIVLNEIFEKSISILYADDLVIYKSGNCSI